LKFKKILVILIIACVFLIPAVHVPGADTTNLSFCIDERFADSPLNNTYSSYPSFAPEPLDDTILPNELRKIAQGPNLFVIVGFNNHEKFEFKLNLL
jgi:hypothetical protein